MKTVLITGAAGSIGKKIRGHIESTGAWAVRPLDRRADADAPVIAADLSDARGAWVEQFAGVQAVIHLAGNPYPTADWEVVARDNVDASLNVLAAVRRQRIPKLIFASSNWVMAGYRFTSHRLTPDLPPSPINAYGSAKLFIERAGLDLARQTGSSFIAFRIGYCQHQPGNMPGPHMDMGSWGQFMWLSDRDLCQGFERALAADVAGGVILNLMSNNPGMRWDLQDTRRTIGYVPQDGHTVVHTETTRASEELAGRAAELKAAINDTVAPARF